MSTEKINSQSAEAFDEKQFLRNVLDSNLPPIEKIAKIADNPQSSPDIIAELLKIAPYPDTYFEGFFEGEPSVCANGATFFDYIATNYQRFEALKQCDKEMRADTLLKPDRAFLLKVGTAVALFDLYASIDELIQTEDPEEPQVAEKLYKLSMDIVEICAIYMENAHVMSGNDLVYYRVGQKLLLDKRFKSGNSPSQPKSTNEAAKKQEAAAEATVPQKPEETSAAPAFDTSRKPTGKKLSTPLIALMACGGVFVISLLIALLVDNSLGNFMLLFGGIAELIVAFLFLGKVNHDRQFVCPSCGTQRIHHRKYLETTSKERFFERNPDKKADESIHYTIAYTHHYLSTFTCPKCGEKTQEKTTDGGGMVTVYYSKRQKDTRTSPSEI